MSLKVDEVRTAEPAASKYFMLTQEYNNNIAKAKLALEERNKIATKMQKAWVFTITSWTLVFLAIAAIVILIIALLSAKIDGALAFTNRVDPFGTGIRYQQYADHPGSSLSNLYEQKVGNKPLIIEPLTSTPEAPNFAEHYGVEANLKDGKVMIERENFENSALSAKELEKANKGF